MESYLDSLIESRVSASDSKASLLRTRHLLALQRLRFPEAPGLELSLGAEFLHSIDSVVALPPKSGYDDDVDTTTTMTNAKLEQITAHFCGRCGARRTADNVRVRLQCDKNIKRRVARLRRKEKDVLKLKDKSSSSLHKSRKKPEKSLSSEFTPNDRKYLKRYGDYATTRKTTCLTCKFEKKELIRGKGPKKGESMGVKTPHLTQKVTPTPKVSTPKSTSGRSEKKAIVKEKQKSSIKKCAAIRQMLQNEGHQKEDDKQKSLKDFLSLLWRTLILFCDT